MVPPPTTKEQKLTNALGLLTGRGGPRKGKNFTFISHFDLF